MTSLVVPVLACRLSAAGVPAIRPRISPLSPATGSEAWNAGPNDARCAKPSICTIARAVTRSSTESPLPSLTVTAPGRTPALSASSRPSSALPAAADPTESRRGSGAYIDDTVITGKVKVALVADPELKATEINVDTYKGTVQLSGFVASPDDIPKAAALAARWKGCAP